MLLYIEHFSNILLTKQSVPYIKSHPISNILLVKYMILGVWLRSLVDKGILALYDFYEHLQCCKHISLWHYFIGSGRIITTTTSNEHWFKSHQNEETLFCCNDILNLSTLVGPLSMSKCAFFITLHVLYYTTVAP